MLDLDMGPHSAFAVLRKLASLDLAIRIVVLSSVLNASCVVEALRLGARGVMGKDGVLGDKIRCIRAVSREQCWVNNVIIGDVLAYLRKTAGTPSPATHNGFGLTLRERDILPAVCAGRTNREIAQEFKISEETVKHHLTHIYDKLGVSTRLELAFFAVKHPLTGLDSALGPAAAV
jgi:DNA-binding NarL/FixJ family response regulator